MELWKVEYILQTYSEIKADDTETISKMFAAIDWEASAPYAFQAGWDCAVHCMSLKIQDALNGVMK